MAAYLDEGVQNNETNQSDMVGWLKQNNLQNVIPIFNAQNMTMKELDEYGEDENALREYLKSLHVPEPSIHRICFKIKKKINLKNNNDNHTHNNNKPKIVRIFITDKEADAIRKLNQYSQKISTLINELQQSHNDIMATKQKVKSQINAEFNNLINIINNKQENVLQQLEDITQNTEHKVNASSQYLQEKQKTVQNAIKECNSLIENSDMEKYERKEIIVATIDSIVNEKISFTSESDHIIFKFNKSSVNKFVSDLTTMYNEDLPVQKKEKDGDDIKTVDFIYRQQTILKQVQLINLCWDMDKPEHYQHVVQAFSESLFSISQYLTVSRATIPDSLLYQNGRKLLECVCGEIINRVITRAESTVDNDISMDCAKTISMIIKHISECGALSNDLESLTRNSTIWKKFLKLGDILNDKTDLAKLVNDLNQGELDVFEKETLIKLICALWQESPKRHVFLKDIELMHRLNDEYIDKEYIDKEFIYESDYDRNGICYALGTNFGKTKWTNPAGLIGLYSSGWSGGSIASMVGRTPKYTLTQFEQNAWIMFDFGDRITIKPTAYTLRHYKEDEGYLRYWNLLASNDGSKWTVIRKHGSWWSVDESLNKPLQSYTWSIPNCKIYYKLFKIQMTAKNSDGYWDIRANGFEIYGHLIRT